MHWHCFAGLQKYDSILPLMEDYVNQIIAKERKDTILLLEHSGVITGGTSANNSDLLKESLLPIIYSGRGGKFTYHGPGQRVIYTLINLTCSPWQQDLKSYVNFLQSTIINTLAKLSLEAFLHPKHIGIWVMKNNNPAKIAAIGIRARKWVTFHGTAINIKPDLNEFTSFIPCGINDLGITSLAELGYNITMQEFDELFKASWNDLFNGLL